MPPTGKRKRERQQHQEVVELVEHALKCQPDQNGSALNGDGHAVYKKDFYRGKIPDEWTCQMDNLLELHTGLYDDDFNRIDAEGIGSLEFHYWLARQIRMIDSTFRYETKIGKGAQARAIREAAQNWVKSPIAS